MANSKSTFENFLGQVRTEYLPRSDKFEVTFRFPNQRLRDQQAAEESTIFSFGFPSIFTVMCEEAQLPGLSATNVPYKIGPWTEYRNQNVEYLTQDSVFTFISDGNFEIRDAFEEWILKTVDPVTKEASFHESIYGTINVAVLDNQNNIRAEYQLQEAIPKLINVTPLAWSNTGHIRISVSFAAKRWVSVEGNREFSPRDAIRDRLRNRRTLGNIGGIIQRIFD